MVFVTANAWPDGRHFTAVITRTNPYLEDAIGAATCVYRSPLRWGLFPRKVWGRLGLRRMIEDLARCAAPIPDWEQVSVHIVWHPQDPDPID